MRTLVYFQNLLIVLVMVGSNIPSYDPDYAQGGAAESILMESPDSANRSLASMSVSLRAATGATILFKTEQGEALPAPSEEERKIPHLVLSRNGVATPGFERTLHLSLGNLIVPATGLYIGLQMQTQHNDPDLEPGNAERISIWKETRFIPYDPGSSEPRSLDLALVFQRAFVHQGTFVRTPTDYLRYRLTLFDPQGTILQNIEQDYALLLENQWRVPLPPVLQAAPTAAPKELVLYFCDMVPFQLDARDPESRIPRREVERYIQTELIPAMVKAFEVQSTLWGLPWYPEWSNSRTDEDPESISVALGGAGTWFHGAAPSLGHAMISIRVDGIFGEYESLTDGIMSVFHHELFHNQQRNISAHFGSQGIIAGKEKAWEFFSEGTAVLASLVGQPAVQWEVSGMPRSYIKRANTFIGSDGMTGGGLNKSYTAVPYHTALFWRFLYEQCGGVRNGVEDPATGMRIIRHALEVLYSGRIVGINSSTSAIETFPRIIDEALQKTPSCAFSTFDETLIHFTRSVYMLRRAGGRCQAGWTSTCGFFDPGMLYSVPPAEGHAVTPNGRTVLEGSIGSSFGLDLVELSLDPSLQGRSVRIVFDSPSARGHEFNLELWRGRERLEGNPVTSQAGSVGELFLSQRTQHGYTMIEIDSLDLEEMPSLDLAITRMDTYEDPGDPGQYTLQVIVE